MYFVEISMTSNLDETSLFYKLVPNKTLSDGPVEGKKYAKID